MYAALSGGTLLQSVMSQQYNCLNGTVHKLHRILLFMKIFPLLLYLGIYVYMLGLEKKKMIVHAFIIELNQHD